MEVILYSGSPDDEVREAARRWGTPMPNGCHRVPLLALAPGFPDTAEVRLPAGPVVRFVGYPNLVVPDESSKDSPK